MRRLRDHVVTVGVLATLGLVGMFMNAYQARAQAPATPPGQPAGGPNVTIAGPLPLPVTGTINATLAGTPTVTLTNPADLAKALGVQHPVAFTLYSFDKAGCCHSTITVPATQNLIIEYVSGVCNPSGNAVGLAIQTGTVHVTATTGGVANDHGLNIPINPIPFNASVAQDQVELGHLVKIYADAGTIVRLSVDAGQCQLAFSGQAVDVP